MWVLYFNALSTFETALVDLASINSKMCYCGERIQGRREFVTMGKCLWLCIQPSDAEVAVPVVESRGEGVGSHWFGVVKSHQRWHLLSDVSVASYDSFNDKLPVA